jgi:hypothetical protein
MKIESHVSIIPENEEKIFLFLSDLRNLESLVPKENLASWEFSKDTCILVINGLGKIELKVVEREPCKLIKLGPGEQSLYAFTLWLQLKKHGPRETGAKISLNAELNPFLQMMAKAPLQRLVNALVEQMAGIQYP